MIHLSAVCSSEANSAPAAPCYFAFPLQLVSPPPPETTSVLVSERCFKAKDSCPAFIKVFLLSSWQATFIRLLTFLFFAIWHIKIICMSEKALPEDKSKIKFKFPSTIFLVQNTKNTMVSIGFTSALYQKMFIHTDIKLLSTNCCYTAEVL